MRHLPPVGLPLQTGDIRGALSGVIHPAGERRRLVQQLTERLPGKSIHLWSSGRTALYHLLRACRSCRPGRTEVLIAGYTCWSVAAAAVRAGLTIRPVDIDPRTLDFDGDSLDSVEGGNLLAIISHHLLGYPNEMGLLEKAAKRWGAFLIDDAAQGWGATLAGRAIGSFGDAGILSFGRGKSLPALGGGAAIVAHHGELAAAAEAPPEGRHFGAGRFPAALAHQLFFPPSRYHIPARLPFLGLGKTIYDESFALGSMGGYAAALANRLLGKFDKRREDRVVAASRYDSIVTTTSHAKRVLPLQGASPSYLRYGLVLSDPIARDKWIDAEKLGISRLYPASIDSIPDLPRDALAASPSLPGCREAARSLITLPTHPLVTREDQERIARFVGDLA